jgi:hypothetical protein
MNKLRLQFAICNLQFQIKKNRFENKRIYLQLCKISPFFFVGNCYNSQNFDRNGESKMRRIFSLLTLTILLSMAAFADIRVPDKTTPTPTPELRRVEKNAEMLIQISSEVTEPTLIINKDLFGKYTAATSENTSIGINSIQTIVGGLFLSLAFVFGGVWLARGKVKMTKAAISICVAMVLGFGGVIAYANIPPPLPINKNLFKNLQITPFSRSEGTVKVILSDEDDPEIRFIIPAEDAKPSKKGE